MIRIEQAAYDSEAYRRLVAFRDAMLRAPLGLRFAPEQLADDADSLHFTLLDGEQVIGSLLTTPLGPGLYKLRQMAIAEGRRRAGLGRRLVRHVEDALRDRGARELVLNAREDAVPFYRKLGYEPSGDPFLEIGIPHQQMRRRLIDRVERRQ